MKSVRVSHAMCTSTSLTVDVELSSGISSMRSVESDLHEILAHDLVELRVTEHSEFAILEDLMIRN
jgi:hypothetical protein